MTLSDVFNLLFIAGFIALSVYAARRGRQRKQARLAGAERIGIQDFVQTDGSMEGNARGHHLSVRFVASTKQTPAHTNIEVSCVPCAVELHLRLQDAGEQRAVAEGRAVDVILGDPAFDAAWIVEGAPAARVQRVLLDPTLRTRLVTFSRIAGASIDVSDGKLLSYRLGGESDDFPKEAIDLALSVADAVVADAVEPLEGSEPVEAGAGYRTAPRDGGDAAGAAEIQALKTLRGKRALHDLGLPIILCSSFGTAPMLIARLAGGVPVPVMIAMLVMALFLTAFLLMAIQSARSNAPGVPLERTPMRWMIGCWALNLALAAPALLGGGDPGETPARPQPAQPAAPHAAPSVHEAPSPHRAPAAH